MDVTNETDDVPKQIVNATQEEMHNEVMNELKVWIQIC